MHTLKNALCAGAGVVFSAMAQMFGGWDAALGTLIAFMAVDYVTGFLAAAVFHKSRKTEDGTLESRAGWKGLCRKGMSLAAVLVACRLDLLMGSDFIRDAVVIGFAANEALSILENAGLMGVPLPGVIVSAVHVLRDSSERAAEKVEESDADARAEGGRGMRAESMPFSGGFRVASPYGLRTDPITGEENVWHGGIDLVSRAADGEEGGAEVLAVFPGVVLHSRIVTDPTDRTSEWGNYVSVLCDDGLTYYYCHLAGRLVSAGESVDASRPIGIEGSTGRSTGIHLHLEIRGPDGETLDPAGILGIENRAGFVFPPAPASDQAEPWRAEASGWSEEAVDWAVRVGILKGRGNGNYALKDPITREEMCVMMHRFLGVVS